MWPGARSDSRRGPVITASAAALLLACAGPSREPVAAASGADAAGPKDRSQSAAEADPKDRSVGAAKADPKDRSVVTEAGPKDRSVVTEADPKDRSAGATAVLAAGSGERPAATAAVAGGDEFPGAPAPIACAAPAGMACIPAGPFLRGSDDGPENTRPAARVWLQTFYMDIDEVTYAEYKACVKARRCDPSGPGYTDFDRPRQPINGISWFDADKYCRAMGKRLPSEAQWEKAARGSEGALHPWGDEPATCERAIIKDERGRSCGVKKLFSKPDTGRPFEVGSRPAYRHGLRDMSGNSWEWVSDWYTRSYAECGADCLGVDPLGPCAGAPTCASSRRKLVRGGSWYWDAAHATAIFRRPHVPDNRPFHHFGFRCAASADEAAALPSAAAGAAVGPAAAPGPAAG